MTTDTIQVIEKPTEKQLKTLEEAREFWSKIAKQAGWFKEPFKVQLWVHENGDMDDCVSFQGLDQDIILPARIENLYEEDMNAL